MVTLEELNARVSRLEKRYEEMAAKAADSKMETQMDKLDMAFENGFERLDVAFRRFENRVVLKVGALWTANAIVFFFALKFLG